MSNSPKEGNFSQSHRWAVPNWLLLNSEYDNLVDMSRRLLENMMASMLVARDLDLTIFAPKCMGLIIFSIFGGVWNLFLASVTMGLGR